MKKPIFIVLGTLIILLVVGVWSYLFIYGVPANMDEVFATFSSDDTRVPQPAPERETTIDVTTDSTDERQALRQLTTRPVAGAVFVEDTIRYVEKGTGYIYTIDLVSGAETLTSNTTIPQTVNAAFDLTGDRVVLTAQRHETNEILVASLATSTDMTRSLDGVTLPEEVSNVSWNKEGKVNYLLSNTLGSAGYAYDPIGEKSSQLFQIPLKDVEVLWGTPTYVYTTPTARQTGYVYRVIGGEVLEYITSGGKGLMAFAYDEGLVVTQSDGGRLVSSIPHLSQTLPLPVFNEKCVQAPQKPTTLYCAASIAQTAGEHPDDWYKGNLSYSDSLWEVDLDVNTSVLLSHFLTESGREIDVSDLGTDATGTYIYFINKNDGTLWMFDTTL